MSEILNQLQSMLNKMSPLLKKQKTAKSGRIETSREMSGNEKNEKINASTQFQARVEASQAKIIRNNIPAQHDQSNAQLLNPPKPKSKSGQTAQQKNKLLKKIESNNQLEKQDRSEAKSNLERLNTIKNRRSEELQEKAPTQSIKANDKPNEPRDTDVNKIKDSKIKTALRDRLKKMDIDISEEQLNDLAFLKQMLEVAEAMNLPQVNLKQKTVQSTIENEINGIVVEGTTKNVNTDPSPSPSSAPSDLDPMSVDFNVENIENEKPDSENKLSEIDTVNVEEHDIGSLLKNRIAELSELTNETTRTSIPQSNLSETSKPTHVEMLKNGWNEIQNDSNFKQLTPDSIPNADLDKLRVIQASAILSIQGYQNKEIDDLSAVDHLHSIDENQEADSDKPTTWSDVLKSSTDSQGKNNSTPQNSNSGFGNPNQGNREIANQGTAGSQGNINLTANLNNGNPIPSSLHQIATHLHLNESKNPLEKAWSPHQPHIEKNILDQIAKKLNGTAHLKGEEIRIQLDPENLGKVHIGLGLKDGLMNAKIGVENEHVKKIIEDNLQTLRDSLENQGIKIQGMEVNVEQRHSSLFNPDGSNSQMFFNRHDQTMKNQNGTDNNVNGLELVPETETGRRLGYNTMEYIA